MHMYIASSNSDDMQDIVNSAIGSLLQKEDFKLTAVDVPGSSSEAVEYYYLKSGKIKHLVRVTSVKKLGTDSVLLKCGIHTWNSAYPSGDSHSQCARSLR